MQSSKNPKTTTYEFFGPAGTAFLTVFLPAVVLGLYTQCNGENECTIRGITRAPFFSELWHPHAFLIFVLWLVFHALIYFVPDGKVVEGSKLRNGTKLKYRINALHAFALSHVLFAVAYFYFKVPVTFVYDHYLAFAVAATVFSFILACYLYAKSFSSGALLALGGNSGNIIYDWFMGRELNPRVGQFDWKFVCELRPGLIGWVIINYCMMAKQYELYGTVTVSMILVCAFQFVYVLDALYFEESILTTMDVIHDGFGFMLAFGDLAWVPFTYSLQARFLVDNPIELTSMATAIIVLCNILGYVIFRGANSQKDQFRRNPKHPSVRHLSTLQTSRGTKLITSGWWGFCRHPNYVGDMIMALCWSLPCGFNHVLPYFYFVTLVCLLIHRQLRDEHNCRMKYGADWERFCSIVKWRLFPGVY